MLSERGVSGRDHRDIEKSFFKSLFATENRYNT